jgi:hypothetical protein
MPLGLGLGLGVGLPLTAGIYYCVQLYMNRKDKARKTDYHDLSGKASGAISGNLVNSHGRS